MKAAPDAQLRLLDLQALDTQLDQLAHRRSTLPEIAELADLAKRLDPLHDDIVRAETEDSDQAREQTKIENDVDLVRSRAARDQQRLDSGAVSSPKELENLQHEIASLSRRQIDLEEQVLEVMERREEMQHRIVELHTESDRLTVEHAEADTRRRGSESWIDTQAADVRRHRDEVAAELPADLLALYEKVRASSGGTGAAALHRAQCQGCHLTLSGQDVVDLRAAAADEVVRCEECRRILVRTPESGL